MRVLVFLALVACAHAKPPAPIKPAPPIEVHIVGPVEFQREIMSCYAVQDMPEPPDEMATVYDDEADIIKRTAVNIREYNKLVDWSHQMMIWAGSVVDCLNQLTTTK